MPANLEKPIVVDLPDLTATRIDGLSMGLEIKGNQDLEVPQLKLEGEDGAFEHSFREGVLNLQEKGNQTNIVKKGRFGNLSIRRSSIVGSVIVSGDSVVIIDGDVVAGDVISTARRRATLLLPEGVTADHDIKTMSGSVDLDTLVARILKIATHSGSISVNEVQASSVRAEAISGSVRLNGVAAEQDIDASTKSGSIDFRNVKAAEACLAAVSGSIRIDNLDSDREVAVDTISGSISVTDSGAPAWVLKAISGDIVVDKDTVGRVNSRTVSGRTRVG